MLTLEPQQWLYLIFGSIFVCTVLAWCIFILMAVRRARKERRAQAAALVAQAEIKRAKLYQRSLHGPDPWKKAA